MDLKKLLKKINFFIIIFFFPNHILPYPEINSELAFITNQESNKVDVIDLNKKEKIYEFTVGSRPAGIHVDNQDKKIFIANPESDNLSIIDLNNKSNTFVNAGKSPIAVTFSKKKEILFASNWYDNTVTVIDLKKKKIKKVIPVGKSPAGLYFDKKNNRLFIANREDNSVSVVDVEFLKEIKKIPVQSAPFGVFSDKNSEFIFVTNVQSNSVSLINKDNMLLQKNILVGSWPYQVAYNSKKRKAYVSNQRSNSISILDLKDLNKERDLNDVCEYPEGIDISYAENLLIVACWFEDNIILLDLDDLRILKKISVSGGPRAFGKFILRKKK